jgi:hypothetical protein
MTLSHEQMIQNMLQQYGLESCKHSSLPVEANHIVRPDPHKVSREKILVQLRGLNPTSREVKSLQSKLDQMKSDSRTLGDSEKQKYMQIVGSLQYVATVQKTDIRSGDMSPDLISVSPHPHCQDSCPVPQRTS